MLFIDIFVNNLFIFSVSLLTVFLRDGNMVLFSDIILYIISSFLFSSCISLWSVVFKCVVFLLLLFCVSIQLKDSCFSISIILIIELWSCWHDSLFICRCTSDISMSENQPFFIIFLAWSVSLFLVLILAQSFQISIILF